MVGTLSRGPPKLERFVCGAGGCVTLVIFEATEAPRFYLRFSRRVIDLGSRILPGGPARSCSTATSLFPGLFAFLFTYSASLESTRALDRECLSLPVGRPRGQTLCMGGTRVSSGPFAFLIETLFITITLIGYFY